MKKILIIDGYNVMRRVKGFDSLMDSSLRSARARLVEVVAHYRAENRAFHSIIIVFDGKGLRGESEVHPSGPIRIVFSSSGESADDRIRRLIQQNIARCRIAVVSDDNYVRNSARAHGADALSCADFSLLVGRRSRRGERSEPDEKALDDEAIADINKSLRRIWRLP